MKLTIFLSLLCSGLGYDSCIKVNRENILQEPDRIELNSGGKAVLTCSVLESSTIGSNMRKRFKKILSIVNNSSSIDDDYKDRLSNSGNSSHFSVTLKNLTVNDTDVYLCCALTMKYIEICSSGTLIIVHEVTYKVKDTAKEEMEQGYRKNSFGPTTYIITISAMLVLCLAVLMYMKLKKTKEKQNFNQNTYVDMTQIIRRNTMGNSFIYNRTENGTVSS
ncbi:uncharacterized protein LOC142665765 isoform X2 [Rhinoderma darwinii]|uniref:uncharacterized protein LOC142665765 isoform X2 n=1 Tax=Rhinoderma darwinii TaxID=43563 RepID=UPI003F66B9DF